MVCIDWLYAEVQEETATALPQHRSKTFRPVTKAAVAIASPATSAEQTAAAGEDATNAPNSLSKHAIDVPQTCKAGQCPMLQPVLQQQQQQRHVWDSSLQPGSVVPASYLQIHPASKQQLKQHTPDVLDSKSGRQLQAQQPVTVRETCFDTW